MIMMQKLCPGLMKYPRLMSYLNSNILYILHLLQNSTIQTAMSPEQNTAGYDLFLDDWSSSSCTYSVGDISSITGASSDDIACLDDIQEGDYECEDFDEIDVSEDTVSRSAGESEITQEQHWLTSPGYILVIDNVDMNVRRSYQRVGSTTTTYHFCHGYAAQNRVHSTKLADGPPSGTLTIDDVLPSINDLESSLNDFEVLVSR